MLTYCSDWKRVPVPHFKIQRSDKSYYACLSVDNEVIIYLWIFEIRQEVSYPAFKATVSHFGLHAQYVSVHWGALVDICQVHALLKGQFLLAWQSRPFYADVNRDWTGDFGGQSMISCSNCQVEQIRILCFKALL